MPRATSDSRHTYLTRTRTLPCQVTTTYAAGHAFIDYNCPYESAFYRARQRQLNSQVLAICPTGMQRYINTPSEFLTPRDYFPNYDWLAEAKTHWDPGEIFRVIT